MTDEWNLEKLKKYYSSLQEKYNLPSFEELNEDFQIEKVAEYETDFVLKEIRENVSNKFLNYLRFIESLLNPSNGPMFMFAVIKTLGEKEREKLTEIYKKIAKMDIELVELDLIYSEEAEAKSVKDYFESWQTIKQDLLDVVKVIKNNLDSKEESGKGNYLG